MFSDYNAKMCPGGAKSYVGDWNLFFVQYCLVIFAGPPWDFHIEICNRAALGFSKCMLDYHVTLIKSVSISELHWCK